LLAHWRRRTLNLLLAKGAGADTAADGNPDHRSRRQSLHLRLGTGATAGGVRGAIAARSNSGPFFVLADRRPRGQAVEDQL